MAARRAGGGWRGHPESGAPRAPRGPPGDWGWEGGQFLSWAEAGLG